jgi:AcrR family transcriptional regulator
MREVNTTMPRDRKSTQRERLLSAMVRIIAAAGVSRPTFYEYFTDKDDCFIAALAEIQQAVLRETAMAIADAPSGHAAYETIKTLAAFACSEPECARMLTSEALAAGPRVLDTRDQGLSETAQLIEQANERLPADTMAPDLPARAVLGTVHRLLTRRPYEGHRTASTPEELLRWLKAYERPLREHRWRNTRATAPPEPWAILPETLLREPAALPRRRGRDANAALHNQRQRILYATATIAQEKGYAATTIAEIRKRAGVDSRAFNTLFTGKQDAFMELIALGFGRTMAVTAGAFFTAAAWPDRIWEAGRAFTEFFQSNPALAHVGFVEPYAVGPDAAQHVTDSINAFTVFLQEGLRHAPPPVPVVSGFALEAIATSVFEVAYIESRQEGSRGMSSALPRVAFVCLAPIIGAEQADRFVDGRLSGASEQGVVRS